VSGPLLTCECGSVHSGLTAECWSCGRERLRDAVVEAARTAYDAAYARSNIANAPEMLGAALEALEAHERGT
jgi:hypothetical protein